jgi:hypothetical protein
MRLCTTFFHSLPGSSWSLHFFLTVTLNWFHRDYYFILGDCLHHLHAPRTNTLHSIVLIRLLIMVPMLPKTWNQNRLEFCYLERLFPLWLKEFYCFCFILFWSLHCQLWLGKHSLVFNCLTQLGNFECL